MQTKTKKSKSQPTKTQDEMSLLTHDNKVVDKTSIKPIKAYINILKKGLVTSYKSTLSPIKDKEITNPKLKNIIK